MRTAHTSRTEPVGPGRRFGGRLLLAAGAAAAILLVLSHTDGTYAMLRDGAAADAGSVVSGSAGINLSWAHGHDEARWQNLLPGESARQQAVVTNTGEVPLAVTVSAVVEGEGFEVHAVAAECSDAALPVPAAGEEPQSLSAPGTPEQAVVVDAATSLDVCVEVTATSAVLPDDELSFAVRFDGMQVR